MSIDGDLEEDDVDHISGDDNDNIKETLNNNDVNNEYDQIPQLCSSPEKLNNSVQTDFTKDELSKCLIEKLKLQKQVNDIYFSTEFFEKNIILEQNTPQSCLIAKCHLLCTTALQNISTSSLRNCDLLINS